ncbi:uncharacterized protein EDB93DRAFT_1254151 [Suillus bovinus]|uniref:uncharacterized protein n=1 Tax=Suillus bovinus TaxID=48563 RepID=UPI001B85EBCE|nr:uncharacterized protein EDB93DRAFT_1254151 [Suillus bovinus]KAG2135904.1 hypothetical protein EDB93DRAFT_1254151 [Suillus bovinus]
MSQYAFPSPRSPYSTHQPIAYTTSSHSQHGHGGYNYGTPLKRASSVGHTYISSPQYGYPSVAQTPQTVQYLSVPSSHHRNPELAATVIMIADPEPLATVITGMGTDTVQLLVTQLHTQHLLPYMSNLAQDIIALIQRHTVRTRGLLGLMQATVITREVVRPQSGTVFASSLEGSLHRTLTTETRGTGTTTLTVVREMLKEDRGNTVALWTTTGTKWIVMEGGFTTINSSNCFDM